MGDKYYRLEEDKKGVKIVPVDDEADNELALGGAFLMAEMVKESWKDLVNPTPLEPIPGRKQKRKSTALALCIIGGPFGLHKFYEEKIGMGILYLFTGGLFGIGALIDLLIIIFGRSGYYYVKESK